MKTTCRILTATCPALTIISLSTLYLSGHQILIVAAAVAVALVVCVPCFALGCWLAGE